MPGQASVQGRSPSLKARALRYLSQREHSRAELERKLAPHALPEDELRSLLDDLALQGWLSDARFAESLVHRRASRYGIRRITAELDSLGVAAADSHAVLSELRHSEAERAWQTWARRFDGPPESPKEMARQQRFLLQRGYGAEVVRGVLQRARQATPR